MKCIAFNHCTGSKVIDKEVKLQLWGFYYYKDTLTLHRLYICIQIFFFYFYCIGIEIYEYSSFDVCHYNEVANLGKQSVARSLTSQRPAVHL